MEIFLRWDGDIDELALKLREALNLPHANRTPYQTDQRRISDSRGGVYYLFEVLGTELLLLRNGGEAEVPEWREYPYYIVVQCRLNIKESDWDCLTRYLCGVLVAAGMEAAAETG
jgi:hypothetical protein